MVWASLDNEGMIAYTIFISMRQFIVSVTVFENVFRWLQPVLLIQFWYDELAHTPIRTSMLHSEFYIFFNQPFSQQVMMLLVQEGMFEFSTQKLDSIVHSWRSVIAVAFNWTVYLIHEMWNEIERKED